MSELIHSVATRFHLYRDVPRADAATFQKDLVKAGNRTDHGLRFTKFFGRWEDDDKPEVKKTLELRSKDNGRPVSRNTEPVLDWLDPRAEGDPFRVPGHRFKTLVAGDKEQLTQACNRLAALGDLAQGGTHFDLDLISRLLIGIGLPHPTENGFLFHPTLGVPYVPGTALKQVAQDYAEDEKGWTVDHPDRLRLFGSPDRGMGSVAFLDALPLTPVTLTAEQITNHYSGYYQWTAPDGVSQRPDTKLPADWYEPIPVTMLALDASFAKPQPFRFALRRLRGTDESDVETAENLLINGLAIYGVGARTTVGFGRFESSAQKDARRPLDVGDRVRIINSSRNQNYVGRTGRINKVLKTAGHPVQVAADDGGGKFKGGPFQQDDVERIAEDLSE